MRIGFLLEWQYPPYPKWFGTAFARLACAPALRPHLEAALHSRSWQEREAALARRRPFGSVDFAADNTDVLEDPSILLRLQELLGS